jgi:hypothetical protein
MLFQVGHVGVVVFCHFELIGFEQGVHSLLQGDDGLLIVDLVHQKGILGFGKAVLLIKNAEVFAQARFKTLYFAIQLLLRQSSLHLGRFNLVPAGQEFLNGVANFDLD